MLWLKKALQDVATDAATAMNISGQLKLYYLYILCSEKREDAPALNIETYPFYLPDNNRVSRFRECYFGSLIFCCRASRHGNFHTLGGGCPSLSARGKVASYPGKLATAARNRVLVTGKCFITVPVQRV